VLAGIKAVEGRIFFIGVGGSAANCSHAVNDFRKLAGVECYAPPTMSPTDRVSTMRLGEQPSANGSRSAGLGKATRCRAVGRRRSIEKMSA